MEPAAVAPLQWFNVVNMMNDAGFACHLVT